MISVLLNVEKMAENEIIQPPEDIATKTIVEKTASFVSKYESEIMLNDVRFNFLRSEANLVSIDGPVFEKDLRDSQANDPRFNFLRDSSDEYHEYYQRRLAYYTVENRSQAKING